MNMEDEVMNRNTNAMSLDRHPSGSALLITLMILSLITIIAVAFLGTMTWELSAAKNSYENQKARSLAMLGMGNAISQIQQALEPWDNPYQNFASTPPTFYWSTSPGIITRWSYTSTTPITNYPLFSSGTTDLVDLNAPISDGSRPIAGGANPPSISVYWASVLKNPAVAASASNPIVGRYAFWVDDENAKININTADGTMKYQTNSLGLGSPSEVSLQALQQGGSSISAQTATNIVYLARTTGLNSPKEILRASGTTPDLYTNNVFNLTAYSRSPDLNIFGQPKMALMPILGNSFSFDSNMAMNSITLQPPREIYPTPSQLPKYQVVNAVNQNIDYNLWYPATPYTPTAEPWPLTFRGHIGLAQNGNYNGGITAGGPNQTYIQPNYMWINGMMLANYLAGKNAAYQTINWPVFPGASSTGFAGKYSPRQIDSIVAQILSLGAKEISPDYPSSLDNGTGESGSRGRSVTTPPLLFGWLSHQWVSGMGRSPKVDALELALTAYGSFGSTNAGNYKPPQATLNILQEWWLPASYLGGKNDIPAGGGINYGPQNTRGFLNAPDMTQNLDPQQGTLDPTPAPPAYDWPPAAIPKGVPDSSGSIKSYWGNQVLANNQGIDFQCNPSDRYDPDQVLAKQYHSPYAYNTNNGPYYGVSLPSDFSPNGALFYTPLEVAAPQAQNPVQLQPASPSGEWAAGELRCAESWYPYQYMSMQTSADGGALTVSGGIQVHTEIVASALTDLDPTPLESIRGSNDEFYDGEQWTATDAMTGSPGATVRDRTLASVIPTSMSVSVPSNHAATDPAAYVGNTVYVVASVFDPLVNKFPGDWSTTTGTTTPANPSYWPNIDNPPIGSTNVFATPFSSTEYASGFRSKLSSTQNGITGDPDSYWLPQADVPICGLSEIAGEMLIPRSARFPNIGYLQYLRSGIIPDDESLPYSPSGLPYSQYQHGTPFRLLSYAPSTDTGNQKTSRGALSPLGLSQPYPDWALLDLFYVPSILAPFGGHYGYYDTSTPPVWQGFGNPSVLADYSTGGGSTPGRINPNGAVIYTTNATVPQPGAARTVPLQAMVYGLSVNQTLNSANLPSPTPGLSGGSPVDYSIDESDAKSIPVAIERYIRANGPLRMPAEICNVPEIASLRPTVNATRNDLVRQVVGNLTTQSNTFSVWVAGESIVKSKANNNPANQGIYESGDLIPASIRYHFVVERYLDPGADGTYGNTVSLGPDGVAGTYDDPVDPINHPFEPRYLYRVVSSEEIR